MAEIVNPQLSHAITQTSLKVLGEAPATALAGLYQTLASSLALAAMNAVQAQQNMNIAQQAATNEAVAMLFSVQKREP